MSNQPFDQDAPQERDIPQRPFNPPTVHQSRVPASSPEGDTESIRQAHFDVPSSDEHFSPEEPTVDSPAVDQPLRNSGSSAAYRVAGDSADPSFDEDEKWREVNSDRSEERERNHDERNAGVGDFFDRFVMKDSHNGINFMMVFGLLFTLILPPFAVIFSYFGLRKAQRENSRTDALLSVVGIVLGLIGVLFILFTGFQSPHMLIRRW